MRRPPQPGFLSGLLLLALVGVSGLLGTCASAQEVDPGSGRLVAVVTDVTVSAGAITLDVTRVLGGEGQGLLGSRWRLTLESRLVRAGSGFLWEEGVVAVPFARIEGGAEYRAPSGERLTVAGDGRAVLTRMDLTRNVFDAQGRLVERDRLNGNRALFRYDAGGRLAGVDGPRGSFLRFTLDGAGRVVGAESSTGDRARYVYRGDDLVEVETTQDPPVRYTYDGNGFLVRIEDPASGATVIGYDAQGRVTSRSWADGSTERYLYEASPERARHVDVTGAVTTRERSADGRRKRSPTRSEPGPSSSTPPTAASRR